MLFIILKLKSEFISILLFSKKIKMNALNINKKKKDEARISSISRVSGFSKTQQSLASHDQQIKTGGTPHGFAFGIQIGGDAATAHHLELQARPSSND